MSTWNFQKADTVEGTIDELIKQMSWIMGKLDSKNVKQLDTNETIIKSKSGKTYIHGPILEMDDTNIRRLNMGLNESTNEFMFELYNEAGAKTVSIDSDGKGVFNQVTLRNDLVGSAYVQINTSGLVAYNSSVKTIEVGSDGNATFKQVTLRNDLTGAAYVQINTSGLVANNGTVNTVEINTNGNATFKQVTLRNDLTGAAYVQINTSGLIANNGTVNTVEINTNGNATFKQVTLRNDMTGSNYINIDTSGIYAWDNALLLKTFEIDSSGKAYFRGDITSDATITGTTINGATITGGTVRTASSGERIELSGDNLKTYNSLDQLNGLATNDVTGSNYGDIYLYDSGTKVLEFYNTLTGSGYNLRPTNGASLFIGDSTASALTTYTYGNWDFNSATILNLVTDSAGSHSHGSATGSYGGHDHGIPNGTVLSTPTGTVTFYSVSDHYHSISSDGSHSHNVQ